jgi:hypothetical protein
MQTVNQRVKAFLDDQHIRNEELRKMLIVKTKAQVSNWLNDKEQIPEKYLFELLRKFPNLNANWIINGSGTMFNDQNSIHPPHNHLTQSEECTSPVCQERIKSLTEMVRELREFKRFLQETVDDLRRKEAATGKRDEGGVESGNERRAAV